MLCRFLTLIGLSSPIMPLIITIIFLKTFTIDRPVVSLFFTCRPDRDCVAVVQTECAGSVETEAAITATSLGAGGIPKRVVYVERASRGFSSVLSYTKVVVLFATRRQI